MPRPFDNDAMPYFATATEAALSTVSAIASGFDRAILRPLRAMHQARVGYRELAALDDRQLADIGLNRSEIALALTAPQRVISRRPSEPAPANLNERARRVA
jgi:uncharacterized protein YjiS (DUF1127 family)